jgi:hypothetical protein
MLFSGGGCADLAVFMRLIVNPGLEIIFNGLSQVRFSGGI